MTDIVLVVAVVCVTVQSIVAIVCRSRVENSVRPDGVHTRSEPSSR
jgi:hypothetical protein